MRFLRTNTAVLVTVGPFYGTDGLTIKTALTITNERITLTADTDAGSAPTNILDNITGATSATANDLNYITGNDAGMMQLELAAADVNRLGRMMLSITDAANHVPVFHEFMVLPAMIYDAFVLGTDVLDASVTQWLGTAASTPTVAGVPNVNAKTWNDIATVALPATPTNITAGVITTVTNLTNAPTAGDLTATMKTSVTTAATASTPVAASVTGAVGSVTGAVGSVTGAVGSVTGAVGSVASGGITAASFGANAINAAKLDPDVTTELQAGLATAAALSTVNTNVNTIVSAIDPTGAADLDTVLAAVSTAMTESYAADGAAMTMAQALYMIKQTLHDFAISGTTLTVKKLDGSTTALTLTLNSATSPTSATRAT